MNRESQVLAAAREARQTVSTAAATGEPATKAILPERSRKSKPEKAEQKVRKKNLNPFEAASMYS